MKSFTQTWRPKLRTAVLPTSDTATNSILNYIYDKNLKLKLFQDYMTDDYEFINKVTDVILNENSTI